MNIRSQLTDFKNSSYFQLNIKKFFYFDLWFGITWFFQLLLVPIAANYLANEISQEVIMKSQHSFTEFFMTGFWLYFTVPTGLLMIFMLVRISDKNAAILTYKACYLFLFAFLPVYTFIPISGINRITLSIYIGQLIMLILTLLSRRFVRKNKEKES